MPEHIVWFYLVFSSQILLLSFYVPRRVVGRLRYVVETYPPETHPKLYPVSMDALAWGTDAASLPEPEQVRAHVRCCVVAVGNLFRR